MIETLHLLIIPLFVINIEQGYDDYEFQLPKELHNNRFNVHDTASSVHVSFENYNNSFEFIFLHYINASLSIMSGSPIYESVSKKSDSSQNGSSAEEPQYCPMSPVIIPNSSFGQRHTRDISFDS